jgi:hypothetical protein
MLEYTGKCVKCNSTYNVGSQDVKSRPIGCGSSNSSSV